MLTDIRDCFNDEDKWTERVPIAADASRWTLEDRKDIIMTQRMER